MNMKLLITGALLAGISSSAVAYNGTASYQWDANTPSYNADAKIFPGTIDTSSISLGTFIGLSPTQPSALSWGDSGAIVGWDDNWASYVGDGQTNGDHLDGKWVQMFNAYEGWWDLGVATTRVVVFLAQDHGPYLGEGTEFRVTGSDSPFGGTSAEAVVKEIYLDGWRPWNPAEDYNQNGWTSDDISVVVELPAAYRYVRIAPWSYYDSYNEPEVDAVAVQLVPVQIDIKPGSYPNSINLGSNGSVPVAILSTSTFDATQVDPASITLASAPVQLKGQGTLQASYQDVNGDGLVDLVVQVSTEALVLSDSDILATLNGKTFGGIVVRGSDSVRIVP